MSDRLKDIQDGYAKYTWIKMKVAVKDLLDMVGSSNLAAEIFQADCEKKDKRIAELISDVEMHFEAGVDTAERLNDAKREVKELQSQVEAVRQISADEVAGRIVSSEAVERIQQALQEKP